MAWRNYRERPPPRSGGRSNAARVTEQRAVEGLRADLERERSAQESMRNEIDRLRKAEPSGRSSMQALVLMPLRRGAGVSTVSVLRGSGHLARRCAWRKNVPALSATLRESAAARLCGEAGRSPRDPRTRMKCRG